MKKEDSNHIINKINNNYELDVINAAQTQEREAGRSGKSMKNFEQITATPEALGAFLAALPVADGPWDTEFRRVFCAACSAENCDGGNCPHSAERNNPLWWLMQDTEQKHKTELFQAITEAGPGMIVNFAPEDVADIERMAQMEPAHGFPLTVIPDEKKGTLTITKDGVTLGLGGVEAVVLAQIILDQTREAK